MGRREERTGASGREVELEREICDLGTQAGPTCLHRWKKAQV